MKRPYPIVRTLLWSLAMVAAAFLFIAATPTVNYLSPPVVATFSDLTNGTPSEIAPWKSVSGKNTPGDFGAPLLYRWDKTNALPVDAVTLPVFGKSVGRYVHAWNGDVRVFTGAPSSTNDHSTALTAAMAKASALGIPLRVVSGTYETAGITLPGGSTNQFMIVGENPLGTKQTYEARSTLKLKDNAGTSLLIAPAGTPVHVENLAFDGNKDNNVGNTNALIYLQGAGVPGTAFDEVLFRNVLVRNAPARAFQINRDEPLLEKVRVFGSGGHGIALVGTSDPQLHEVQSGYNAGDGVYIDGSYIFRLWKVDSYHNGGSGLTITNSGPGEVSLSVINDNLKHGLNTMAAGLWVEGGRILRNNAATNLFGANPDPTGTYSEIRLFGTFQYSTFTGVEIGERSNRDGMPAYLVDDDRTLADDSRGTGITFVACTMNEGAGYVTGRWRQWTQIRSTHVATYDVLSGRTLKNQPRGRQSIASGSYPYTVRYEDGFLILTGVGRSVVLPSTNSVPNGWTLTVVDAAGNAETNPIVVSSVDGTVYGAATNRIYDTSSIRTYVKDGANYGVESVHVPETSLLSDMAYRWTTRGGPRLKLYASQEADASGVPVIFSGYRTNGSVYNMVRFYGSGGSAASPSGLVSNSAMGGLEFTARTFDGGDSGAIVRVFAVPDEDPYTTNQPGSLLIQTTKRAGGGSSYMRIGPRGISVRDDGSAALAGATLIADFVSTNGVIGLPAMTTAQLDALSPVPRNGSFGFDSTLQQPVYWSNSVRVAIGAGGGSGGSGITLGNKGAITVQDTNVWTINGNAVVSTNIIDGTVATADLADSAVTTGKIADGTIAPGDMGDFSDFALPVRSTITKEFALGSGTVLTNGSMYSASLSANRTITFSGTATNGQSIVLYVNATAVCTLTFPSSLDGAGGSTVTSKLLHVGRHELSWKRWNGEWVYAGSPVLDNTAATAAPTTGDDIGDGYSITSHWWDTTNDDLWVCLDATLGAAVWKNTTSGGGTVTSVAVSGGTTGLSTSGGPVTGSGTITITGTLDLDNGGTGATTASAARAALGTDVGDNITSGTVAAARIDSAIARLVSPTFTGTPTAPTASAGSSNTTVATTAYVDRAVATGGGGGGGGTTTDGWVMTINTGAGTAVNDGTTYILGPWPSLVEANGATYTSNYSIFPVSGTIKRVDYVARLSGNVASAEPVTNYIRINNSTDEAFAVNYWTNQVSVASVTNLSIAVTAGDTYAGKLVTPVFTTDPSGARHQIVIHFERTVSGGGSGTNAITKLVPGNGIAIEETNANTNTVRLAATVDLTTNTVSVATPSITTSNAAPASTAFVQQLRASTPTGLMGDFYNYITRRIPVWAGSDFTNELAAIAFSNPSMKGVFLGPYEFDGSGSSAVPMGGVGFNSGTATHAAGYLGRPGIYQIGTGSLTNGGAIISSGDANAFVLSPTNYSVWFASGNYPAGTTGTNKFAIQVGWSDSSVSTGADPTDAAMAVYNANVSTNWHSSNRSNTTETPVTSTQTYPVADSWGHLSAVQFGTNWVKLYWNGTCIVTNTATIPTGTGRGVRLSAKIFKLGEGGVAATSILMDLMTGVLEIPNQ